MVGVLFQAIRREEIKNQLAQSCVDHHCIKRNFHFTTKKFEYGH